MSVLREVLEQACAAAKCSAKALTVLAAQHDPFRIDTPARHRDGQWLAVQAERHGLAGRTIHLRGFHYLLVSTTGLVKPNGKPYGNTEDDWTWLVENAAKAARWLRYIPFEQIVDARKCDPIVRIVKRDLPQAHISVGLGVTIPEAEELEPFVWVDDFPAVQSFRPVFFGERTSLDPVLGPIAEHVGADLYLPAGEISDTLLHMMAKIGAADGRPMVVLTLSDCDPAGWQMPISIARKLQALKALLYPELVFQVRRVALTPDHLRQHDLPSSPLKDTEKRADRWREKMGVEQTEIDAPAALRPDLLGQIASQAIAPFFDPTLTDRCSEASEDWRRACQRAIDAQTDQTRLAALRGEAEHVLATLQAEIDRLNRELSIDPDAYQLPAPVLPQPVITAEPDGSPLIDSAWAWSEQTRRLIASKAYDGDGAP